ncbi:MAG: alcohol dehydrogenase catalytic domain-containing protein [Actinobacteria bacterium]|nr:alcohol dehydrogenase catalytic domain-containing protein [Actinomycetota bacterium]
MYTAPLELRVLDVDDPVPGPEEVLVRVRSSGICGSELEGIRSQSPFRVPPLIMGHEFAGERLDTGERVVVNPIVACGTCHLCLRGSANLCLERSVVGIHRAGGFAELVAVPETILYRWPDDATWEQAALVEPLANAVHAWRLVADRTPARVGILGAGTIGLVCLLVARWRGALEVHIADLADDRLRVADEAGATSVGERLDGEFDLVIDAVGAASTRKASVDQLRRGGVAVWLGLHSEDPSFTALDFIRNEQAVLGSFAYTDLDFRQAIALATSVDPSSWVRTFPLHQGADIFAQLMRGRTDVVKAQLVPG